MPYALFKNVLLLLFFKNKNKNKKHLSSCIGPELRYEGSTLHHAGSFSMAHRLSSCETKA